MSWKYLRARKKGNGLSFMTLISVLGLSLGVAALIIVLSVMGGFEQDLKGRMLRGSPHLEILADNALAGFSLKEFPLARFQEVYKDAVGIEPFTQADIVLKQGQHVSSGVMFGIEPTGGSLWGYKDSMVEGQLVDIGKLHAPLIEVDGKGANLPGIVLGDKLAHQLSAEIGDEVSVLSPQTLASSSSAMSGATMTRSYVVVGIFRTGLFNYDSKWAVVSLDEGRKFLQDYDPSMDEDQYVSGIGINAVNPIAIEKLAERIKPFQGLKSLTWKEANSSLILALKLEKFSMGSILMLIVLVAAFSISGTMMMSVFHRKREVCLLRSLGMTKTKIVRLFLIQAQVIAMVGISLGLGFGLVVCTVIYQLRFFKFPPPFEMLKIFPIKFLPVEYAVICLFAWMLSLIGACYPAWIASKHDPSRGLRY